MVFGLSCGTLCAQISKFRTPLLIIAFLLLGVAYYVAYKPRSNSKEERSSEDSDKSGGISFGKLNRVLLWIVAGLTIAFAFMPEYMHLLPF